MYGTPGSDNYNDTHTNTNSSTIKGVLDTWYENNIGNNPTYSSKIETNVGFCGDRALATKNETWWNLDTKKGYGTNITAYKVFSRMNNSSLETVSYQCTNLESDLYTATNANIGNKSLKYSIGLITIEEMIFSGGFGGTANQNYWLYTNCSYWTITPTNFTGSAHNSAVYGAGQVGNPDVSKIYGVRPVINLKSNTQLIGTGTTTDPYVVV